MEDQQKLEELVNQLNMYKQQSEMLQQQVEAVQASIAEVKILENTLDDIKDKDTIETLVPVGAGSFMNAEIKNQDKIIMSVGAGVAIAKNFDEAKVTTAEQKKELEDSLDKLFENLQKITDIVAQLSPQAEQLMQKVQASGQMPSQAPGFQ